MIHRESALLCDDTSLALNVFDMAKRFKVVIGNPYAREGVAVRMTPVL